MAPRESTSHDRRRESSANKHRRKKSGQESKRHGRSASASTPASSEDTSQTLSAAALARLNQENLRRGAPAPHDNNTRRAADREYEQRRERDRQREKERERERAREQQRQQQRKSRDSPRKKAPLPEDDVDYREKRRSRRESRPEAPFLYHDAPQEKRRSTEPKRKSRVVSGAILEEGRGKGARAGPKGYQNLRGGAGDTSSYDSVEKEDPYYVPSSQPWWKKKKKLLIPLGIGIVVLIIIIAVAVTVSKNNANNSGGGSSSGLSNVSPSSIPSGAPSWLNPFVWADTTDFNLTYTNVMVGDLPIMGLNSTWDDSQRANPYVPALNEDWGSYADRPARGVNVGGWLSIEPFITPSLFNYDLSMGIIDEYTLCQHLGSSCESTLEKHYATFVTESTFSEIAAAGLDHVRIPFSYWAVQTYDTDPYVYRTSWRYLLRAIEWCRRYGLRVNLDLHGLPGSQNGWNHSGRQGAIGWLNGTDGDKNAQRSLDVHDRLSQFFAQDRYQNIISHYGLANEPKMTFLSVDAVLNWTTVASNMVRKNGVGKDVIIVFGDGFRGLANWQGELQGLSNAALDVHQYVIFNTNQIVYNHTQKVNYACQGWTEQTLLSMNPSTGYGPTLVAEWSQADTDCAKYLTNVGWGNRWTGTYVTGNSSTDITTPRCPTTNSQCECNDANADASQWSDTYKQFLRMFAEAQMTSFEKGWGWFYWVWDTESAPQWSYKQGMAAGILPQKAYARDFYCNTTVPSFSGLLPEYY
ncbi:glycoside hydrolase [Diplogelasinospora grovesii]|uniref:glucan 1,3-beta-glucosidase n=1 Tax=Diplogelasinospora grovesii TaxID=303347 RepID=A0AAN6S6A8_9PEZI|nr:glycoside hydrolase [Diplogelasinospora grovesii]